MTDTFDTFNEGVTASMRAYDARSQGNFEEAVQCDEQAIACFDRVLETEPKHTSALGGKAMSLAQLGRTSDAVGAFEAAIQVEPIAEFYRQLGLCQVELGDMKKAWIATRKAISMEDSQEYRANAATELVGFGDNILGVIESNRPSMSPEQIAMYHQWAASTYALACETDAENSEARSLLASTEQAMDQLPPSTPG
ncbi:tetratricopeptide repeat protein [Lignipirellula cremea]|uniref:Tetratricopeptide repeat protein n=1 Tax=Lignipirellula cremea TaxID=2528010 RepID=A0A518DPI9_9BACT|nr:tetratricopeptide repeat protein [Lignipirellula cremea]QDU93748.1 Tetratricopeptide repeat protein [Lignipirellula cremea]